MEAWVRVHNKMGHSALSGSFSGTQPLANLPKEEAWKKAVSMRALLQLRESVHGAATIRNLHPFPWLIPRDQKRTGERSHVTWVHT